MNLRQGIPKATRVALALALMGLVTLFMVFAGAAHAQSNKVIRMIVPFAPGGGQEILARTFYSELGVALGQTVIIENRAGAGGAVGSASVAKSPPDGLTVVIAATGHTVSALLSQTKQPPYDPIRDFTPIAHIAAGSQAFVINAKFPAKTLPEFIKQVKAKPGAYNYGSSGNGSSTHLSMAYFCNVAGLQMLHVPYKSSGEQVIEQISGRMHVNSLPIAVAMTYAKEERLRLLAVTSRARSSFLPEVPTVAETFPGYTYESWFGLLGPAGTPQPIVDRMNSEVNKLLNDETVRSRIAKLGLEPAAMSPDAFERLMREEYDRLGMIIKKSGITAD
jgi:tripartite-type tricarboxylate transporter receptor subunit TctC